MMHELEKGPTHAHTIQSFYTKTNIPKIPVHYMYYAYKYSDIHLIINCISIRCTYPGDHTNQFTRGPIIQSWKHWCFPIIRKIILRELTVIVRSCKDNIYVFCLQPCKQIKSSISCNSKHNHTSCKGWC